MHRPARHPRAHPRTMTDRASTPKPRAILLVGPTGSGKSPIGMFLETIGPFRHFDFGAELRAAAEGQRGLESDDVAYVRHLLDGQLLLPDERFGLAVRLLEGFIATSGFDPAREWLVLNGLPRHIAQARALAPHVNVRHVFVLDCDPETVAARVARRRRGESLDHPCRPDDTPEAVARKLAIYQAETLPLIDHYRRKPGTRASRLAVAPGSAELELARTIAEVIFAKDGAPG